MDVAPILMESIMAARQPAPFVFWRHLRNLRAFQLTESPTTVEIRRIKTRGRDSPHILNIRAIFFIESYNGAVETSSIGIAEANREFRRVRREPLSEIRDGLTYGSCGRKNLRINTTEKENKSCNRKKQHIEVASLMKEASTGTLRPPSQYASAS